MKYKTARRLALALLALAGASAMLSLPLSSLFPRPNLARGAILAAGGVLVAAAVVITLAWYRCPRCGRLLGLERGGDPGLCHSCGKKLG